MGRYGDLKPSGRFIPYLSYTQTVSFQKAIRSRFQV
jgi:hypothetical protein